MCCVWREMVNAIALFPEDPWKCSLTPEAPILQQISRSRRRGPSSLGGLWKKRPVNVLCVPTRGKKERRPFLNGLELPAKWLSETKAPSKNRESNNNSTTSKTGREKARSMEVSWSQLRPEKRERESFTLCVMNSVRLCVHMRSIK